MEKSQTVVQIVSAVSSASTVYLVDYDNSQQNFANGKGELPDDVSVVVFYGAQTNLPSPDSFPKRTLFYRAVNEPQAADVALTMTATLLASRSFHSKLSLVIVHGGDNRYVAVAATLKAEYPGKVDATLHGAGSISLFDLLDNSTSWPRKACGPCRVLFSPFERDSYSHDSKTCDACKSRTCSKLPDAIAWDDAHKKLSYKFCEPAQCTFAFATCQRATAGEAHRQAVQSHCDLVFHCQECDQYLARGHDPDVAVARARHHGDNHAHNCDAGKKYKCPHCNVTMKANTFDSHVLKCKRAQPNTR